MNKRREGKPVTKRGTLIIVVVGLIIWAVILLTTPTQVVKVPIRELTVPPHWPGQTVTSPVPTIPVPVPVPKVTPQKPTSQSRTIYYTATGILNYWGVKPVLKAWSAAKYEDLKLVVQCPATEACVTIKLDYSIDPGDAAVTDFYTDHMVIRLNPAIRSPFEAQSAVCHEVGHTLGLPHLVGTINSCMPAIGDYRVTPSVTDLKVLDRLGHWTLKSAYESSRKDVDVRKLQQ